MKIADLGDLDGPLILFGGPYSNFHAFQALLQTAQSIGVSHSRIISTGDIVAYCADGASCVAAMRDAGIRTVAGNCEKQLAAGAVDCGCGFEEGTTCEALSVSWFGHAQQTIGVDLRQYMAELPDRIIFQHAGARYAVIHGGASDIAKFLWPSTADDVFRAEIRLLEAQVGAVDHVIAGHCGMAFKKSLGPHTWINTGTIGLPPNDGRPSTRYAILDDGTVTFHELDYDAAGAKTSMERAGLTQGYHNSLLTGFWPSEDILPLEHRRAS